MALGKELKHKICEEHQVMDAEPVMADWSGPGCVTGVKVLSVEGLDLFLKQQMMMLWYKSTSPICTVCI